VTSNDYTPDTSPSFKELDVNKKQISQNYQSDMAVNTISRQNESQLGSVIERQQTICTQAAEKLSSEGKGRVITS